MPRRARAKGEGDTGSGRERMGTHDRERIRSCHPPLPDSGLAAHLPPCPPRNARRPAAPRAPPGKRPARRASIPSAPIRSPSEPPYREDDSPLGPLKSSGRSRALRPIPAAWRGSPQSFRPLPKAPRGGGTAASHLRETAASHLRETSVPRVRAHRARPASRGIASEALGEGPRISVRRCPPERGCRRSAGRERPDGPRARPRAQRAHRTRPG